MVLVLWGPAASVQAVTFDISTSDDFVNPGDGVCSVREALIASELQFPSGNVPGECPAGSGVDTLDLSAITGQTLTLLAAQPLTVAAGLDITILGSNVTIDGDGNSRVLELGLGASFEANELNLQGGFTADRGGAIVGEDVTLTLLGGTVTNNTAGTKGGGIFAKNSEVSITNTFISANTAGNAQPDELGGGIAIEGGALMVSFLSVSGNTVAGATGFGGGISAVAAEVTLEGVQILNNDAPTAGGLLIVSPIGTATLTGLNVNGNTAERGGGMVLQDGTFELDNPEIRNNTATQDEGGGLVIVDSTVTFLGQVVQIEGNDATLGSGGGLHATNSDLVFPRVSVEDNSAALSGGGIFLSSSKMTMSRSSISQNEVTDGNESGGGLHLEQSSELSASESRFNDNLAGKGGAISVQSSSMLSLEQSLVTGNSSKLGGAFQVVGATLTLSESTVTDNSASSSSIGLISNDGTIDFVHATIAGLGALGDDPSLFFDGTGGTLNMTNSILFTGQGVEDCGLAGGAVVTVNLAGNNLVGDAGDCVFAGGGDLIVADPLLAPLADNGGRTDTRMPMTGSPGIDAGDDSVVTEDTLWDQRGVGNRRIQGLVTDLGAFEIQGGRIRIVDTFFEVQENAGFAEFVFSRVEKSESEVRITLNTQDDEASSPADYVAIVDGSLTWADGEIGEKTVKVIVNEDLATESPEDFQLIMSGPTGGAAFLGNLQATARIIDVPPPAGVFKDGFEDP